MSEGVRNGIMMMKGREREMKETVRETDKNWNQRSRKRLCREK